jgi:protein TonB
MKSTPSFLGRALVLSLILHAAMIVAVTQLIAPAPRAGRLPQAELSVSLRDRLVEPDVSVPARPQLLLPRAAPQHASAGTPAAPRTSSTAMLLGEAAVMAAEQLQRELPYPPEAIERGLQGEALVLLFLDQSGNAIAARLESSSGHAVLDEAAVRAVRTLRSLPAGAPREALVPVRFRLR